MNESNLQKPILVAFDGEARSGKGTIVQAVKDYLRDHDGLRVMLIDAGQVFRVLVVAITRAGVDIDSPEAIDRYLEDKNNTTAALQLVKDVYHMSKEKRDDLLYTNTVGRNSAKVGARPLSQVFKDNLLRKWLHDAGAEGYDVVLLDGRALGETGTMLEDEGLCRFMAHYYFVCEPRMGARRTLGHAGIPYDNLSRQQRIAVDELVEQIIERNASDANRKVQPIVPPAGAPTATLPEMTELIVSGGRIQLIIDTSGELTKEQMTQPVALFTSATLGFLR